MTILLAAVLSLAVVLLLRPPGGAAGRFRRSTANMGPGRSRRGRCHLGGVGLGFAGDGIGGRGASWRGRDRSAREREDLSLTLVVQQLAALLKGGRTPARLWDELWLVHGGQPDGVSGSAEPSTRSVGRHHGPTLSAGSLVMLGAVRAAAFRGSPVSDAIRKTTEVAFSHTGSRESRIWWELAACFDIAEASGCPLADVLARFAAQLEVETDAEAARQTALAGPKATVSLLTWLPLMGLGLGIALGVDPLAILIGTPLGMAALAAGVALTVAGRIWSARLVHAAAGAGVP